MKVRKWKDGLHTVQAFRVVRGEGDMGPLTMPRLTKIGPLDR